MSAFSAVRATNRVVTLSSRDGWRVRNSFLCAVPGGLGTAAQYDVLEDIIN
ncbi:hypothetical protein AB0362_06750 [Rhodococcus sp. NPDC079359]|uniref:hypothetical protein n=1 Tax=Rhodococcus sp. NPDC079359 TaxID=3154961 RepID=UPI00344E09B3